MIRAATLAALLLFGTVAEAQKVVVRDPGPDPVGRRLEQVLADPTTTVIVRDSVNIPRDSTIRGSLVIVGHRASVAGEVRGYVIVTSGDLFLRPGVRIGEDAIAIGGGVYGTMLGVVAGSESSFRDFTYDAVREGNIVALSYRETYVVRTGGPIALPGIFGLRIPTYDRTNGVSIGFGPSLETKALTGDLVGIYRSNLGQVDPQLTLSHSFNPRAGVDLFVGQDTRTNDDWINGRLANSLNTLVNGRDERDWYRSRIARATFHVVLTPLGATRITIQQERASAVKPFAGTGGGPWSLTERHSTEGMLRPNIAFALNDMTGVAVGQTLAWIGTDYEAGLDVSEELMSQPDWPASQSVADGHVMFRTFGEQRYRGEAHLNVGNGPPQRFGCVGGSGTLPVEETFSMCGNQVAYLDNRYEVPITRIVLPLVGSPLFTFRYVLGGAALGSFPDLTQNIGVRLSIPFVRVQYMYDPGAKRGEASASLSLSR